MKKKTEDQKETAPMDFSPFDPLANLEAVSEAIKTIRHISWSYAGDIVRVVVKIGKTFYAGRCVVCVCGEEGNIDVYEYSDGSLAPMQQYLESEKGQRLLAACLELAPECLPLATTGDASVIDEASATDWIKMNANELPDALREPTAYVFPLRHQYEKRHVVKPGLLLLQEPTGLARWNKRFLDSIVVVAEYLAMVIECERLYTLTRKR